MSLDGRLTIHCGDALETLRTMASGSVDCIVTSPPYFGLRSYDENSLMIDPNLPAETREWLDSELARRGIRAR